MTLLSILKNIWKEIEIKFMNSQSVLENENIPFMYRLIKCKINSIFPSQVVVTPIKYKRDSNNLFLEY